MLNLEYFELKIEALDYEGEGEVLKVNPKEYNYITLIKDVKVCMGVKNEVVEYYPNETFKVEVKLSLSRSKYLISGDKDIDFIFQQYEAKRVDTN